MVWKFPLRVQINIISVSDIDRIKLTKYLQHIFPRSNYNITNYDIHSDYTGVTITSPTGNRYGINELFYNDCLEYNKILEREEVINNVLN